MAHRKQTWPYSCGAACLLVAAHDLRIAEMPAHPGFSLWATDAPLEINDVCEARLYQMTSNNPTSGNPCHWKYSKPSDVVRCATHLGLKATVIVKETNTVAALSALYGGELGKLKQAATQVVTGGPAKAFPRPTGVEYRELRLLYGYGALHYVMVRENGWTMDPSMGAAGGNHQHLKGAKKALWMRGTGLSIILTR